MEKKKLEGIENVDNEFNVNIEKPDQSKRNDSEGFFEGESDEGEGQLAIDVYQTKDSIIIEAPIAGVTEADDLDVSITNESVTIRGKRERESRVEEEDYFYQECYWGRFSRSIILTQEISADKAEASINNGSLTIKLPKLHRQKSKKLRVKFG